MIRWKQAPPRKKAWIVLKVIGSSCMIILFGLALWSLAFIATSVWYHHKDNPKLIEHLRETANAAAASIRANPGARSGLLEQLARAAGDRTVLVGQDGSKEPYGGSEAESFAGRIEPSDIEKVLAGSEIKASRYPNFLRSGTVTVGEPVLIGGQPHALFIQRETGSLLQGYGWQALTVFVNMVLFFFTALIMRAVFMPKQIRFLFSLVDAMRRIAKGDFSVNVTRGEKHNDEFSVLVDGINEMAVELQQVEQMRQEFIANVSHEIQSPLTSISGFTRALHDESLSAAERAHYLDIIETESRRLSKLSDNLLKLSSLDSQHHPFEPKRYRLDKQLRSIVLACEPQWLHKAIEMDICLSEESIVADEELISQVWINLISNSIKFTPDGGTIGVHMTVQNGRAVVRVSDTGIGMTAEDQEHIFERFYKADKSRNRADSAGSGLGLSIAHKIISMHEGSIAVESVPGEGTTFTVSLPIEPPPKEKAKDQSVTCSHHL